MSTAGIYNYQPKVASPNKVFHQMESGEYQKPFYFGGSQVPISLGISTGSGIHTPYVSHTKHMRHMNAQSRGCGVTVHKHHKIYLPKHMSTIRY
jgi:hypothetical protein